MNGAAAELITGQVLHERLRPVLHRFVAPVFFLRLNLARLDEVNSFWFGINRCRLASLRTRDYGARDGSDLQLWMRSQLAQAGIDADGEIWLQTFPRLFGFVFNPVSFWYCHDAAGGLKAVLAEVNNTFGERHRYLLSSSRGVIGPEMELTAPKNMHVSPFCQVQGQYRFKFRLTASNSLVQLNYYDDAGLLIKTAVGGRALPLTPARMAWAILKQPGLTFGIMLGIHWQAFKLWRKGVPFFSKPRPPEQLLTQAKTKSE